MTAEKIPFEPSFSTQLISYLTAPKTLCAMLSIGITGLAGITSLPLTLTAAIAVVGVQELFVKIVSGGDTLRSAVFTEAEHLSRLNIQGGLPRITLPPIINALSQMSTENAQLACTALQGLLAYENSFDYLGINNYLLQHDLRKKIQELKTGELLAIPLSYMNPKIGGHICVGSLRRQDSEKFILAVHNGGDGYQAHPHRVQSYTIEYQSTMEVEISQNNLLNLINELASLHAFRLGNNADKLYSLIKKYEGTILPANFALQYWERGQLGHSCSGYTFALFLKYILSSDEYDEYQKIFLRLTTASLNKGLQHGFFYERTQEHQEAYDELRAKMLRHNLPDPGVVNKTHPSFLAQTASWMQKKFWVLFFPINYQSYSLLKLGIAFDDFSRIGNFREFQKIQDPFRHGNHQELPKQIRQWESRIDYSSLSKLDKNNLDEINAKLLAAREITQNDLNCLYKVWFNFYELQLTYSGSQKLMNTLNYLKNKDYQNARASLHDAYHQLITETLSLEQKEECEYVLIKMLYLPDAINLEDIELRVGIADLFKKGKTVHAVPDYLSKNHFFYKKLNLAKEFPQSPWALNNSHKI